MKNYFIELTTYNLWANKRMAEGLQKLSPAQLSLEQKSSFTSLRKTADHLADCEYNWMKRINGDSNWEFKAKGYEDINKMNEFWLDQSKQFVNFIESIDAKKLDEVFHYKNMAGQPYSSELYQIIAHLMNHSTYHRGQLTTMMRGAGAIEIPSTDLIVFFRSKATV